MIYKSSIIIKDYKESSKKKCWTRKMMILEKAHKAKKLYDTASVEQQHNNNIWEIYNPMEYIKCNIKFNC